MSHGRVAVWVATEVVALGAIAKIQANQGASLESQIGTAVSVIAILTFMWAVVRFLVKPVVRDWVFAMLTENPARVTDISVKARDHDEDTRAIERRFMDRLYADKIASDQETRDFVEANRDRLEFVEASLKAQGEMLNRDLSTAVKEYTRSSETMAKQNEQQTQIMREMQAELKRLSEAYIRLDATVANWDGTERRKHTR